MIYAVTVLYALIGVSISTSSTGYSVLGGVALPDLPWLLPLPRPRASSFEARAVAVSPGATGTLVTRNQVSR